MPANQQDFLVKHGMTVRNTATISTVDSFLTTATNSPTARPVLNLSFISGDVLDPRINFSRASGATYVGKDGFIEYAANNVPRFDYDPATPGAIKGLLIEEARTNIYRYSTNITTTTWSISNATMRENAIQAPDGTYTAPIVSNIPNLNSNVGVNRDNYNTSTFYTKSIYAKYITGSPTLFFQAILSDSSYIVSAYDIQAGAVTSQSYGNSTGTSYIYNAGNGWFRCTQTFQTMSTGTAVIGDSFFIGGYGSTSQATSYGLWGAQSEAGPFASSLIATSGASATRQSDDARISGQNFNSFWTEQNQNEGTVYSEFAVQAVGSSIAGIGSPGVWGFTESTQPVYNGIGLRLGFSAIFSDQIQLTGRAFRAAVVNLCGGQDSTSPYIVKDRVYKNVSAWDRNYLYNYVSNVLTTATNTTLNGFTGLSSLQIGTQSSGGGGYLRLCGWIRRLQFYPNRLSILQMQTLNSATSFTATSLADVVPRTTRTANTSNFVVQQGVVVQRNLEVPDIDKYYVTTQTRPTQQPTLNLNFLNNTLDPRIAFTRASQASYVGADGLIKYAANNVPRFEFSTTSTGTCIGFLTEDTRINYMTYSSDFNFSSYVKNSNPTFTTSSYMAPDGTMNATIIQSSGVVGSGFYRFPSGLSSGTTYTYSIFIKNISNTTSFNFGADANPSAGTANFNIATGTISSNGANVINSTITPVKDGWYRISTTFNSTAPNPSYVVYPAAAAVMTFAVWGAQVEAGTFASSYIPTGAAQVTRAVDIATISGQHFNSWFTPSKGTLYVEADNFATAVDSANSFRWVAALSYGAGQKTGFWKSPGSMTLYYKMADDAYASRFEGPMSTISTNTTFKAAISYQRGNHIGILNAANSTTSVSTLVPAYFVDNLRIGDGDQHWFGHIRRIVFYNQALSYTATQALTLL